MKKIITLIIIIFSSLSIKADKITNMQMEGSDNAIKGLWHFNAGTSTTAYDVSGNGNDGTINDGQSIWVDGLWGKCLDFDGAGDYVELPSGSSWKPTKEISISIWFQSDLDKNMYFCDLEYGGSSSFSYRPAGAYVRYSKTRGTIEGGVYTTDPLYEGGNYKAYYVFATTETIADSLDKWHNIFYTRAPTKHWVYLDGELIETGTLTDADIDWEGYYDPNDKNYIGGWEHNGSWQTAWWYDGKIDELVIWDISFSSAEVKYLYSRQSEAYQ